MHELIEKVQAGCDFVLSKVDKRNKPVCTITTEVRWADWEKKFFSPALAVLWLHRKDETGNLIFPEENWPEALAQALDVSTQWVDIFLYYCSGQNFYEEATVNLKTGDIQFNFADKPYYSPNAILLSEEKQIFIQAHNTAKYFMNKYPAISPIRHRGIKLAQEHAASVRKNIVTDLYSIKASS